MRILEPTENRHINELIGFIGITLAVLLALSLLSFSPQDASFNVAAAPPAGGPAHNWIGPVGAYTADLVFQALGYAAFLFPVAIFLFGWRWFRSKEFAAPVAKALGFCFLVFALPAEFVLANAPRVRGALPAGGMLGALGARALLAAFNLIGAHLVALACLCIGLLLTTQFTFSGSARIVRGPFGPEGFIGKRFYGVIDRYRDWREAREAQRLRKRVEEIKISGRPSVAQQAKTSKISAFLGKKGQIEHDEEAEDEKPDLRRGFPVIAFSERAEAAPAPRKSAADPKIAKGKTAFRLPSPGLLRLAERSERMTESELKEFARAIEQKCAEFDVEGHVTQINPGPVVTTFEFKPEAGIKYSRITSLSDDLCLALRAESILIERIPGKSTVGIEVPNPHRETIALREVIESPEFTQAPTKLALPLGKDLVGRIRAADLPQMPHLLIAGATGTGKSVFINSMLMGMLFKSTPDELKVILVDPKRIELGLYEDIPHLYTPVVTDPKVASNVLRNATREMERRLKLLAQRGVRNIEQYNRTFEKAQPLSLFDQIEEMEHKPLPYIVIVIDELADLMMVDTTNVEESITRLAQMARAVGIHLILATQRPSVDVITGLIKANFPARISFRVASKVDSRTILDTNGAESLLGRGDMLYLPAGSSRIHRIHGPLVTESEIASVCDFWREQAKAIYHEEMLKPPKEDSAAEESQAEVAGEEVDDELYQEAVRVVCEMGRASTSTLQRRLRVGYGRAARLIDLMEKDGIVGPPDGSRPREVLKKKDWMREFDESLK
ncbi:MAG TPA: DNA translocase FtsK [Candidatus Acidoferrales bacterium]|nr:DNA translocase FtsK [Candidatus Acidoferrales bacterium]